MAVHLSCIVLCDFCGSECCAVDPTKPRGLFHEYLIWALVGGVGRELHMLVIGTWGKNGNLGWFGSKLHRVCNNHICAGFDGQVHPLGSLDRCVGPLSTYIDCVFRPHGALFDTTSTQQYGLNWTPFSIDVIWIKSDAFALWPLLRMRTSFCKCNLVSMCDNLESRLFS